MLIIVYCRSIPSGFINWNNFSGLINKIEKFSWLNDCVANATKLLAFLSRYVLEKQEKRIIWIENGLVCSVRVCLGLLVANVIFPAVCHFNVNYWQSLLFWIFRVLYCLFTLLCYLSNTYMNFLFTNRFNIYCVYGNNKSSSSSSIKKSSSFSR